jgi:hypothetical protein
MGARMSTLVPIRLHTHMIYIYLFFKTFLFILFIIIYVYQIFKNTKLLHIFNIYIFNNICTIAP